MPERCDISFKGHRCYRDAGHRKPGCEPARVREDDEMPHDGRYCECGEHTWGFCCAECAWWDWRGRDTRRYTAPIDNEEVKV